MAKDVDAAFDILVERLKPTEGETANAASHRTTIETCLKEKLGMTSMFRSGSFGHGTSVSGFSDVDYFAVFPLAAKWQSSGYGLGKLREVLQTRFPYTDIRVRSPAVSVPFGGGNPGEHHEITPAFVREANGRQTVYSIPDRNDGWMNSAPLAHNDYVSSINDKLAKKAKHLIRLVKYWNYLSGAGIRSFYLELRVAEYLSSETAVVYRIDAKNFFSFLLQKKLAAMQDPLGLSGYVYPCTDARKTEALSRLETALARAQKAATALNDNKTEEAFYWWNMAYFGKFPAYY